MTKQDTTTVATFKGFDKNLVCNPAGEPFQYEVGQTYEIAGGIKACSKGFHACEYPLDVFGFYAPATSRYALVEQSGQIDKQEAATKVASSRIHIKAEIGIAGIIKAAIDYTFARVKPIDPESPASATGDRGAASATGGQGAASATGGQGAASATGDRGAASATGGQGAASATGYQGAASATGKHGVAAAVGIEGKAMGAEGCGIVLCYRDPNNYGEDRGRIVHIRAAIVGQAGVKANTWYSLDAAGEFIEVSAPAK